MLLSFELGALLRDPLGLMEGQGKQVRYAPLREEAFIELILAALDLPPSISIPSPARRNQPDTNR